MEIGFNLVAAKPKREQDPDEAPSRVSMKPQGIRRNPSTDQKKVRRQLAINRTATRRTAGDRTRENDPYGYGYDQGYDAALSSGDEDANPFSIHMDPLAYQGWEDGFIDVTDGAYGELGSLRDAARHDEFFGEPTLPPRTADAALQPHQVQVYLKGDRAMEADPELNQILNNPADPRYERYNKVFRRSFMPYEPGDQVYLAWSGSVRFDGTPEALLEALWHDLNVGGDPSFGEQLDPAIWREYRSKRNRSLSVGDVVVIDGTAWKCDSFGWSQATGFRATASTNDNWWLPKMDTEDERFDYVVTQHIGPADYKAYSDGYTDGSQAALAGENPTVTPSLSDGGDYDQGYIDGYRHRLSEWGEGIATAASRVAAARCINCGAPVEHPEDGWGDVQLCDTCLANTPAPDPRSVDEQLNDWVNNLPSDEVVNLDPWLRQSSVRCGAPATAHNYLDDGKYQEPVCARHLDSVGRGYFKGPEDY